MAAEPDYPAEMALPEGKSCADCKHIRRCVAFGYSAPENTSCDFYPRRFVASAHPPTNRMIQNTGGEK